MMFLVRTKDHDLVDTIHEFRMCRLRCLSSCCSLSRRSFQLSVCQTVSHAGRILLLRFFSRNPQWCEASVPKLGEHQATPTEHINAKHCVGLSCLNREYLLQGKCRLDQGMFLRGGTMVTRSPNSFASTEYAPGPRKMSAAAVSVLK